MKIQIVKANDKKTPTEMGCTWFIEGLPEPRK
jgi:hypothetical protein